MARGTILLVDDSTEDLRKCGNLLRKNSFAVITATTTEEAHGQLGKHPVHLAIVDIRIEQPHNPRDFSGWNLAISIGLKTPVIVLTGYPLDPDRAQKVRTVAAVDKNSPRWDEELLAHVHKVIRPVVYLAHAHSPHAAEVEAHIAALGLTCSVEKPHEDDHRYKRSFATEAERAAFAVVLLTADHPGPGVPSPAQVRARATLAYDWGYFSSKRPGSVCVLREDGAELLAHDAPGEVVEFGRGGAWKHALESRLRAAKLLPVGSGE